MSKYFHLGARSGAIPASSADGVLFAFRVPSASLNKVYVQRVKAVLTPTTPATAAQEVAIQMKLATFVDNYTSANSAADLVTAIDARSLDLQRVLAASQIPVSCLTAGDARIAGTAAMTAGATGPTARTQPWAVGSIYQPATAATAVTEGAKLEWINPMMQRDFENPIYGCLPLSPNQGFLITLPVALGAAFVGRLSVEVDFFE
jgi:hypothetical protein